MNIKRFKIFTVVLEMSKKSLQCSQHLACLEGPANEILLSFFFFFFSWGYLINQADRRRKDKAVHDEISRLDFLSFLVWVYFLCSLCIPQLKVVWCCWLATHRLLFAIKLLPAFVAILLGFVFLSTSSALHMFMFVGTTNVKTVDLLTLAHDLA